MIRPDWTEEEATEALTAMRHVLRDVFDPDEDAEPSKAEQQLASAIRKVEGAFRKTGKRPPGLGR